LPSLLNLGGIKNIQGYAVFLDKKIQKNYAGIAKIKLIA
jgi:hypothetical protein